MLLSVKRIAYRAAAVGMTFLVLSNNVHADNFKALPETKPRDVQAIWFAPEFDFDSDSCLPDAAIDVWGKQNGGLNTSGTITGGCRHEGFMELSNTYHRYVCKEQNDSNYCAHVYALYFQKDQANHVVDAIGHRHDFEFAVVWTLNGQPTHASTSAHGKLSTYQWKDVPKNGNHPKVVYHKEGTLTHAFRLAKWGEIEAENPTGKWVRPPLASYYTMKGHIDKSLRELFTSYDYGKANLPTTYWQMLNNLNSYKPAYFPTYTLSDLEASR
jgi:hypothetical protein